MGNATPPRTQTAYKSHHHKHVRSEALLAPENSVFIEWPPLAASRAERLDAEVYQRLLRRRLGTYRIISVGLEYVKSGETE